jgi:sulfopyruvate decarboxylase TPP-binding subunit
VALDDILGALERAKISHVLGIPDNTSGPLFDALRSHPGIRLVIVTREGEAFAMASGLWIGGARPLVVIQNTGLLEAGDALRGTALRMAAPIPVVVTGRGYGKMTSAGVGPDTPRTPELMTRADVDSVALVTEPTLDAWVLPWTVCGPGASPAHEIEALVARAETAGWPQALLLTGALT